MSKSTVLSVLVEAIEALPAASWATPAARLAITVPSPVIPLTAALYVMWSPLGLVTTAVVAPAVPPSVTSPVAKSLTASPNTTVKSIGDALVGSA